MQITINTADILGDEATIRDEVIAQVATAIITSMRQQAKEALSVMLEKSLAEVVKQTVTDAADIVLDEKFTDMDQYGRPGKEAKSIRERISDYVQAQCTFKPTPYSSDANPFTRVVKETTEAEVKKFKADFSTLVTKQFISQTLDVAVSTLRSAMGIKS